LSATQPLHRSTSGLASSQALSFCPIDSRHRSFAVGTEPGSASLKRSSQSSKAFPSVHFARRSQHFPPEWRAGSIHLATEYSRHPKHVTQIIASTVHARKNPRQLICIGNPFVRSQSYEFHVTSKYSHLHLARNGFTPRREQRDQCLCTALNKSWMGYVYTIKCNCISLKLYKGGAFRTCRNAP
jgi:hypothetical protein